MMQDHIIGRDICLLGPRGSGRSTIVRHFAASLGMEVETMTLYKDMNTRDLLQRRVTHPDGGTAWEFSPLVEAALHVRNPLGVLSQLLAYFFKLCQSKAMTVQFICNLIF